MSAIVKPFPAVLNTLDPLTTQLVCALPFQDGFGATATDLSGNGYNATINGSYSWFSDPTLGTVLQLDGLTAFLSLATAINGIMSIQTTASVAFWLRLRNNVPASDAKAGLMDMRGFTGANAATLYPHTDGLGYFSIFRNVTRVNGVNLGATNKTGWHHLCITQVSNGTYLIYINGVQVGSAAGEFGVGAGAVTAVLGMSTDTGGSYFLDGWLGDFRIWSRLLQAPEVLSLYNNPWSSYQTAGLIAEDKTIGTQIDTNFSEIARMATTGAQIDTKRHSNAAMETIEISTNATILPRTSARSVGLMVDITPGPAPNPPTVLVNGEDSSKKPFNPPTLFADPIETGMVLATPFTEGSGTTAADFSGNANNGTFTGTATWTTNAAVRKPDWTNAPALLPGASGDLDIPRNAGLEPANTITLAAWVYATSRVALSGILTKLNTTTNSYFLGVDSTGNNLAFGLTDSIDGYSVELHSAYNLNTLYHIVGTYDSGAQIMRLYINGVQVTTGGQAGTIVYSANDVLVGKSAITGGTSFGGPIFDVRLWNRVLSATEVTQLFNAPYGIYCNWALDEFIGTQVDTNQWYGSAVFGTLGTGIDSAFYPIGGAEQTVLAQVDAYVFPRTAGRSVGVMLDLQPAIQNTGGMGYLSITPSIGNVAGGTSVTVKGFHFFNITSVTLGGVPLTSLVVVDTETITGVTGAHVAGSVDITIVSSTLGPLTSTGVYTYSGGYGPGSTQLLAGCQLDPNLFQQATFTGQTTPNWPAQDTVLSFTLPDLPISPQALTLYIRHTADTGGATEMRQGALYDYTVDIGLGKITWKASARFTLVATDEITVYMMGQGQLVP